MILPVLKFFPCLINEFARFRALKNHSEVLLRYLYSMAKSLAKMGPSGNLKK